MKNMKFIKLLLLICTYFIIYLTATLYRSDFWGNILSPIGGIMSFLIILYTHLKSKRKYIKTIYMLYGMACLSWAAADIIWAIYDFALKINPEESRLISFLYDLPNFFMLAAVLIFAFYKFRKWNMVQLMVDISAISASAILMLWILFFNKDSSFLELISKQGILSALIIIVDIMALLGIFIWYFSIRQGKLPSPTRIVGTGLLLYFITDLYYYYLYYNNLYIPNSVIDAVYMASLLIIAIGISGEIFFKNISLDHVGNYTNIGFKHNSFLILFAPVTVVLFKGFIINDLLLFLLILLIHIIFSSYVQVSIKNQELLIKEIEINQELEIRIAERTRELTEKNRELDFLSKQDTVTNLYNRRYFIIELNKRLKAISTKETLSLLFIDLDRFKTINDTYGHNIGDQVLVEISNRLQKWDNENTCLARLGGDEFVFCICGNYGYSEAEKFADQIINACNEPIEIKEYIFHVTLSIGISIYPFDADDSSSLMKNADIAMYQAKSQGYNKYFSFSSNLSKINNRRNKIEILLKKADFHKEFILFYQPQFSIPGKNLIGAEALLRWHNSEKGLICPGEFIPVAEETDLIVPIGEWVLKEAVKQIGKWNNTYLLNLKMGINVSPKQLDNINFIKELVTVMNKSSVTPNWIDIEITEGIAIRGEHRITEIADMFKDVGVSISIDDFGTGYSSLSYLKLFPFDRIKIAKSLIDTISKDNYDMQIVKAIIMLSKSIGIKTIAEGVESENQLDILSSLGCEEVQGYLLGKPMPASEFEEMLLKNYKNT